MELGYDGVLLNTAIARAGDPVGMACAFRDAIVAGRRAYEAGLMEPVEFARPSTPTVGKPLWHEDSPSGGEPSSTGEHSPWADGDS